MIFVTIGNAPLDFSRLAKEIDVITPDLGEEVFVQRGNTSYPFQFAKSETFLNSEEMEEFIEKSSLIVSHGGWGTISECLARGKKLVVVPRLLGVEHNHSQEELVRVLEKQKCLIAVYEINNLKGAIEKARTFTPEPLVRGEAAETINVFLETII